ncbi:MAG: GH3 auxin-responsive promoter family protein [Planctomycetaceae bacterium]
MSRVKLAYPLNTLWMLTCKGSMSAFRDSTRRVKESQAHVLRQMIEANRDCAFGREHHFARMRDPDEFRECVPLANYEDFEPWIDAICRGHSRVLTTEPVLLLEPTSGSVSGRRLIPYTNSLKRQFRNGIDAWIGDIYTSRPALRRGRAWWLVSPPVERQWTAGGLSIGFADDTQYLGPIARLAASRVLAVPPWFMNGVRPEDAPYRTLLQLLTVQDLTLISVWSPTLLINLVHLLYRSVERLVEDLRSRGQAKAAIRVDSVFRSSGTRCDQLAQLWPQLKLISCWADGSAAHAVNDIKSFFPQIEIQPKGLISTEAFVSLPIIGYPGGALSVRSHFYEFQSLDSQSGDTLLAHELSAGGRYRVIVTTAGGLYRYQTHDVIEVIGFLEECPMLRFCGRGNRTSDLVGEKLSEVFVGSALARLAEQLGLKPRFAMLVPQRKALGYRLLIELPPDSPQPSAQEIGTRLDILLSENPWYAHAMRIGQLSRSAVTVGDSSTCQLRNVYEAKCLKSGIRRGNIKPTSLEIRFDWDDLSA